MPPVGNRLVRQLPRRRRTFRLHRVDRRRNPVHVHCQEGPELRQHSLNPVVLHLLDGAHHPGKSRLLEIFALEQQILVAVAVPAPERGIDAEDQEREINRPRGEIIEIRTEVFLGSPRVLIIAMTDFMAATSRELRDVHAIVVDQLEVTASDNDVAVLQIAVRNLMLLERGNHVEPAIGQRADGKRTPDGRLNRAGKAFAVDPFHFEDRIPFAPDSQTLGEKMESYRVAKIRRRQMLADGGIALLMVGKIAQKAAHGPAFSAATDTIDARETAGNRPGQTQRSEISVARLQLRIIEVELRTLYRFVVILRCRPRHGYPFVCMCRKDLPALGHPTTRGGLRK